MSSLTLPGAVPADPPDVGVPAHYGNPHVEQRNIVAGRGFVDLSHRGVLRVGGSDRLSWLHSFTSQHLTGLAPHTSTDALILSPHGHIEHMLAMVDDGTATWFHVEPGEAGDLLPFLEKMRFMLDVQPADVSDQYAIVFTTGPAPEGVLSREVDGGRELFLAREDLDAYVAETPDPAGIWAYEALRIAARRPRLGFETDHRTIPHELGLIETAVHLDKGCYRGQETVARVHNLGRPPRRLVFLHLDGSEEKLPAHGDAVEYDGRQIGFVTSAARHYELGPIALALVKRNVPEDATLAAGGVPAAQEVVVAA